MRGRERLAVVAVIIAALALSSLPYVVAYLVQPADRQFMGIVSSVPDWAQYLAWMRGFADHLVIENPLTCEVQLPAFFNLQWLVLGRLSNWLPAAVVLQGFRLLTAAGFLWLTYRVSREYFRTRVAARWLAWLLINFSSGLGWFWVLEKRFSGLADARHPLDIYVYEPVSFQNMIVFPHFLLAAGLLLLIFRCAVAAIEERRMGKAWLASGLALALGLMHAYDLVIVYAVLGVFVVCLYRRDGFSWRPFLVVALIGAISAPAPIYFLILTSSDPLWSQVLAQFGDAGVFTPGPLHLLMLVGLPLLLVLATVRNFVPPERLQMWPLMVRVWAVTNLPLLYIPADFQIHMLSGWQIPLGLLAAEGVFRYAVPWLTTRGWLKADGKPSSALALSPGLFVALLVALCVPTNLYLLAWRVLEVGKLLHTHYLYRDEIEALAWLNDNSTDAEPVMGSLLLSQYVPFLSGNKVFLGHWAQTPNFVRKREAVAGFYGDGDDLLRIRMLASCGIGYVLYGRAERELGGFDPAQSPYLELAHESGETRIYRVKRPAMQTVGAVAAPTADDDGLSTSPAWSTPVWLSRSYSAAWFPDVSTDTAGGVHVFWNSSAFQQDLVIQCDIGADGCKDVSVAATRNGRDGFYATRPAAAVAANGTLHLLWKGKYDAAYQRIFLPDPIDGWTPVRRLGDVTYTAIAVDARGVVHAVWSEPRHRRPPGPCYPCSEVAYSRSEDGGEVWSAPIYLADTTEGSEKPNIALGHDGEIYVVWEEGYDFYAGKGEPAPAMFAASLDGGKNWEPVVHFSPFDLPVQPAIEVAGDGTLIATWRSGTREGVFSQTSSDRGASWSEPQQIDGLWNRFNAPDELDDMDLATDSAGNVHLVVTGRLAATSPINAVYHLVWNGTSWSEPETIFLTKGAAEWPRIAISEGNQLNVVWFERGEGTVWKSDEGHYRVYYSHSLADAPAIAPVVWPKPVSPLMRPQAWNRLAQLVAAFAILAGVITWARRRGL